MYDLLHDPYEKGDVKDWYPNKLKAMLKLAEEHQRKIYFN